MAKRFNISTGKFEESQSAPGTMRLPYFIEIPEPNTVLSGVGEPDAAIGKDGDFYLETQSMEIYGPKNGGWGAGKKIVGEPGLPGSDGKDGASGRDGKDGKDGKDGEDGVGISAIVQPLPGKIEIRLTNDESRFFDLPRGASGREVELRAVNDKVEWRHSGDEWAGLFTVPKAPAIYSSGGGSRKIKDMRDTLITNVANGEVIAWSDAAQAWVNTAAGAATLSIGSSVTSGTAGSILFLNASSQLAQDATNLFWDDTSNYLGIQTAAPVVPCQVGNGTIATPDAVFAAAMNFTGIGNAHCFNDSNVFNKSGSTASYNSYDARPSITTIGTTGGAHYAGYQFRPSLDFTTTLPEMRGYHFAGATELTAGGTVTDMYAFMASSPTVTSGAVTSFYGYYLAASTGGITNYYGLYFSGTPTNLMGSGFTGFGTTAPAAVIHMGGNRSAAAWTTSGIALRQAAATYTDTSSSGTVAACYVNAFATPTLAASSVTTYTTAANMLIGAAPSAGSNVTITNAYSLIVSGFTRFNSYVAIGLSTNPTSQLQIGTNQTAASWTTQGLQFHIGGQTLTDSSGSGTIASRVSASIHQPAFASSSAVTVTNGATLYIEGNPTNGTNTTITNPWAVWVDTGDVRFDGDLAIGVATSPTARLHLGAGTATASTAPLKFTSGTNLTTGEAGAMEYNGTNLFFTRTGTTRESVFVGVSGATAPTATAGVAITNFYGTSATNFLGTPNSWASVVVAGTTYKIPLYT